MKNSAILPAVLGLAHGVSDCAAGLLLGSLSSDQSIYSIAVMVMLYNLLAFGAQPLAGLIIDKLRSPKPAVLTGLAAMSSAILLFYFNPFASVILAGIASALFHTGGGAMALCSVPGKASGAGLFSAPGVAGLAVGGFLAVNGIFPAAFMLVLLLVLFAAVYILKSPGLPYNIKSYDAEFDKHDFIMLVLLLAIALRSAVWNIFQHLEHGEVQNIILISMAAAGGKIFGGYAGDYFGWKRYSYAALAAAVPLLVLGEYSIYFLLPGIGLVQSVTPVMVSAVYKNINKLPATAAGLSFGLAIAAGGIPFAAGAEIKNYPSPLIIAGLMLAVIFMVYYSFRNKYQNAAAE